MARTRKSIVSDQEPVAQAGPYLRITQRAYELYELRGRQHGLDLQDWLQAEQEILRGSRPLEQTATAGSQRQSKVSAKKTR